MGWKKKAIKKNWRQKEPSIKGHKSENSNPSPEAESQKRAGAQGQQACLGHPAQLPPTLTPLGNNKVLSAENREWRQHPRQLQHPRNKLSQADNYPWGTLARKFHLFPHSQKAKEENWGPAGVSSASDSHQGFQTYTHTITCTQCVWNPQVSLTNENQDKLELQKPTSQSPQLLLLFTLTVRGRLLDTALFSTMSSNWACLLGSPMVSRFYFQISPIPTSDWNA